MRDVAGGAGPAGAGAGDLLRKGRETRARRPPRRLNERQEEKASSRVRVRLCLLPPDTTQAQRTRGKAPVRPRAPRTLGGVAKWHEHHPLLFWPEGGALSSQTHPSLLSALFSWPVPSPTQRPKLAYSRLSTRPWEVGTFLALGWRMGLSVKNFAERRGGGERRRRRRREPEGGEGVGRTGQSARREGGARSVGREVGQQARPPACRRKETASRRRTHESRSFYRAAKTPPRKGRPPPPKRDEREEKRARPTRPTERATDAAEQLCP